MGYYTKHKLTMNGKDAPKFFLENKEAIEQLCEMANLTGKLTLNYYSFDYLYSAFFEDWECKFYDVDTIMEMVSFRFPEETFVVEGVGEGDLGAGHIDKWADKYHDGKKISEWRYEEERSEPTWWGER